jgi:thymidylate synthase (FAD)
MASNFDVVEALRWVKHPVLDQGFVCLVDCMGDDESICEAARLSFGKGTKRTSGDRDLIRYLMRHRHTSPFEMAELKFSFRMPQMVWWQMVRHRTASCNVESGRYSEMSEDMMRTPPDGWRKQATGNKQGSGEMIPDNDPDIYLDGGDLSRQERWIHDHVRSVYEKRLTAGVAREQARKDLSMSVYIHVVWKIDLHNLFHFLVLRMDSHAQLEIRQYATIIGEQIVAPLFPLAWEAFRLYQLDAMTLSHLDQRVIQYLTNGNGHTFESACEAWGLTNKREREECRAKLVRLGLVSSES